MTHHQLVLVVDLVRNVEKQPVFERMLRRTLGRALERDLLAFAGADNFFFRGRGAGEGLVPTESAIDKIRKS